MDHSSFEYFGSEHPNGCPAKDEEEEENLFFHPSSYDVEDVESYRPGGYHPIHLGDLFDNGRFKVLHKLGNGSFGTVWLARDTHLNTYVALKAVKADFSSACRELSILELLGKQKFDHPGKNHIATLIHHFSFAGPNGSHLCLVSTVGGPSIGDLARWGKRLSGKDARKASHQITQAVAYLHSLGICHGDITGSNVLLKFANLESWTEKDLYDRLGQPWISTVERTNGDPPGPHAPEYLVEPVEYSNLASQWLTSDIELIDFGEAFHTAFPPPRLATALAFAAPEVMFELKFGVYSDNWALACVIYVIRAGKESLHVGSGMSGDGMQPSAVGAIANMLGPLPDKWDNMSFDEEGMPMQGKMSYEGEIIPWLEEGEPLKHPLIDLVRGIKAEVKPIDLLGNGETNGTNHELAEEAEAGILKPRNVIDREDRWYMEPGEGGLWFESGHKTEEGRVEEKIRHANAMKISEREMECLFDLLSKVLKYQPEERASTEEMLRHEWFVKDFPLAEAEAWYSN